MIFFTAGSGFLFHIFSPVNPTGVEPLGSSYDSNKKKANPNRFIFSINFLNTPKKGPKTFRHWRFSQTSALLIEIHQPDSPANQPKTYSTLLNKGLKQGVLTIGKWDPHKSGRVDTNYYEPLLYGLYPQ